MVVCSGGRVAEARPSLLNAYFLLSLYDDPILQALPILIYLPSSIISLIISRFLLHCTIA
jgi:hypothetical protein